MPCCLRLLSALSAKMQAVDLRASSEVSAAELRRDDAAQSCRRKVVSCPNTGQGC